MSPEQERRLEEIFSAARNLAPREQAAFLDRACADDAELRRQADSLLAAHQEAGRFLQPTVVLPTSNAPAEKSGERIGRSKLLEQIGEGGFGVVWMAEQEEPVRRRVALKIIKLGMDTKEVVARFEAERQALALMDHPHIASVFDGGATGTGRPYFVMELVKGVPITDYCDANKLSTPDRLELFMKVCQAVQHAHMAATPRVKAWRSTRWRPTSGTCWRRRKVTPKLSATRLCWRCCSRRKKLLRANGGRRIGSNGEKTTSPRRR
jgi:hypothetical protein